MTEASDEELILESLSGLLDPHAEAALERRLAEDPALRALRERLLAEQEALEAALGVEASLEDEEVPEGLAARVLTALAEAPAAEPAAASARRANKGPATSAGSLRGASAPPATGTGRRRALLATAAVALVAAGASLLPRLLPEHPRQVMNRQVRTSELLALGILEERSDEL